MSLVSENMPRSFEGWRAGRQAGWILNVNSLCTTTALHLLFGSGFGKIYCLFKLFETEPNSCWALDLCWQNLSCLFSLSLSVSLSFSLPFLPHKNVRYSCLFHNTRFVAGMSHVNSFCDRYIGTMKLTFVCSYPAVHFSIGICETGGNNYRKT